MTRRHHREGLVLDPQSPPTSRRRSLPRLLRYAAETKWLLAIVLVAIVAMALLELAAPWVIGFLLLDRVIRRSELGLLPYVLLLLGAVFIGQRVSTFIKEYTQELANQRILHRLRTDVYERTLTLPLRFFDRARTGELQARLTADVDAVEGFLNLLMNDIATEAVTLVGALSFLYAVSPKLTLYLVPTILGLAGSVFIFKNTVKKYARRVRQIYGELGALAAETLCGIRIVKAFGAEKLESKRFLANSAELLMMRMRSTRLQALYLSWVELFVFAGTLVVIVAASPLVVGGTFSIGALVAYLSYLNKLYGPVKKLSKVNVSVQKTLAAADRILELEDFPQEDLGDSLPPRARRGFTGAIEFRHVSFAYDSETPVVRNVDLKIAGGEVVALVGHSGGGKTTIANLLMGFYWPTAGQILLDGVSTTEIPLACLRAQVAIVPQDTFLFSGSVGDNIWYGRPDASQREVVEAARLAAADDFIMRLPQGYETPVGERGYRLSGGQRQRIAIARALLRQPVVVVLDEATSQLDAESEAALQQALERLRGNRTLLIIAHRFSTVRSASRIVVMEEGEIVETGRHEELLARDGLYRRLYTLQVTLPGSGPPV